jgi:hypothetical protein
MCSISIRTRKSSHLMSFFFSFSFHSRSPGVIKNEKFNDDFSLSFFSSTFSFASISSSFFYFHFRLIVSLNKNSFQTNTSIKSILKDTHVKDEQTRDRQSNVKQTNVYRLFSDYYCVQQVYSYSKFIHRLCHVLFAV